MRSLLKKENWVTLMLCVSVIQVSFYYFFAATLRPDRLMAVAQPDSSLYLQAARRIVEGGAFTFSAGGAVHTGTTSVLYPFLLAVPYALGFTGGSLVSAAFWLNVCFYLVFLLCWAQVIDARVREPVAKVVSVLLLALFGQFAFVSLAQSDTGLWLAVSSLFAFGLAYDRTWIWGSMLVVAPWVRPEGMVLAVAVSLVAVTVRRYRAVAILGLISSAGVFLLNELLTGSAQFSSVSGKGHFSELPFCGAVLASFSDVMAMCRQLFLGFAPGSFREMFFCPVLGAVCLWYHVFRRDYSDFDAHEAIFLLAAAGGFATVATSGWQGTNLDRYLAWILPVAVIWISCGAVDLANCLKGAARFLPVTLVLAFGLVGSFVETCRFRMDCEHTEVMRAFSERCEAVLPKGASIGAFGNAASVYWLSPRRYVHLYGIYSPAFKTKSLVAAFEILKREPEQRFDYWLYDGSIEGDLVAQPSRAAFGETVLVGPHARELRKTDWRPFDAAAEDPVAPADGLRCRARVDVGYEADERRTDYRADGDFAQEPPKPFFRLDDLDGRKIAEVGRVATGGDSMTVSGLEPGKAVRVVMRTARSQAAGQVGPAGGGIDEFAFDASQRLQVFVNGADAGCVEYEVPEKGFADVAFAVPAEAIVADTVRLTLRGGHIACGYWFYQ